MLFRQNIKYILKALLLSTSMLLMFGCATYHERITEYYQDMVMGNYVGADKALSKTKLLKKPRNILLFYMEKGKVEHMKGNYALSNDYFNKADLLIENQTKKVGDVMVGLFLNSMSQSYKGEEFEIFMIHYYKALNYMALNQSDEALIEARRITLQNYALGDKYNDKTTRYSKDAFSLNLQGLIYEAARDYNNAFISYRNAVEVYQSAKDGLYYGVTLPENLKYDLMRMAYFSGFDADLERYEREFNTKFKNYNETKGGEVIIFWENGKAPIKEEERVFFSLVKGERGALFFTNALGVMIPVDTGIAGKTNLSDVNSLMIAYPKYISQPLIYSSAQVDESNKNIYQFELVENIDNIAIATLNERAGKELSKILTRMAVKKAAEYGVKSVARSNDNNVALEALGFGIQMFNLFSEKADTRNWQTLPSQISYARIPLQEGINKVKVELITPNGERIVKELEIEANGRLKFFNFATM